MLVCDSNIVDLVDPKDRFMFMMLERIEKLEDELRSISSKKEWRIRIEGAIDTRTNHIDFILAISITNVQVLIETVLIPVSSFDRKLQGKIYATCYSPVNNPNTTSVHLVCMFDTPVPLDTFYHYLNDTIQNLVPISDCKYNFIKNRILNIQADFQQGKITNWVHL